MDRTLTTDGVAEAMAIVRELAEQIGPRPPCSEAEQRAAQWLRRWCRERGIPAELQEFQGYASGGEQAAVILGMGLIGGLLQARRVRLGGAIAGAALGLGYMESDLRRTPLTDLLRRKPSANLVATIPAVGVERQRVCLCGHMDTTRSGLIFHPAVIRWLPVLVQMPGVSLASLTTAGMLGRGRLAGLLRRGGLAAIVSLLGLVLERELRGTDVAGANDNASGTAVALQLTAEIAARPLQHTRVDLLITGCEEAWSLGAHAYLRALDADPANRGTVFVNFDTVGGDVPLTYILREGTVPRHASPRLVALCRQIAARRPELGLSAAGGTAGLPTDATPALAHGYEAITLLAQSEQGVIPNYHWPSDTYENVSDRTLGRTLEVGRELVGALDAMY